MKKYQGIPELLEAYMEENAADERWITAHELRDRFGPHATRVTRCLRSFAGWGLVRLASILSS